MLNHHAKPQPKIIERCPLPKQDIDFLEKVFACDTEGRFFQSKSKQAKRLEEMGYIVFSSKSLGRDCFGSIVVSGYSLTVKGNYTYCFLSGRCEVGK